VFTEIRRIGEETVLVYFKVIFHHSPRGTEESRTKPPPYRIRPNAQFTEEMTEDLFSSNTRPFKCVDCAVYLF
jgi:hypothetical protein